MSAGEKAPPAPGQTPPMGRDQTPHVTPPRAPETAARTFIGATGKPADYQRVTAAELRKHLDVLAPPPGDLAGTRDRPTLSGPSTGCPFLLDARKNPLFEGLDLDPERVQTKGCTFCLDNSGAYVAVDDDVLVAAWIEGLRRIRAARPDAREVLLTDERPHRALPAFFEAIAREPALGPVELLWKSRVDWLLEFAADVERACAIAERTGSVVHLYLVGFESFDRGHLDLFNKGHGPELNERAIDMLRDLERRFPRSFAHRKYRSHGIVLFTPWTRPEALLENARWMRRLRFHELRAEAVKTRLRLYPRVPLHRLAERDGLLAEHFTEGRGDRAAEQGYDASVPWRFQDPRTEAIFQLANALHAADRTVTDADLIEIATRFVVRWPGLADAPQLAHLPLRAAIEAWGAPLAFLLDALGPAAIAFDPEIEAIGRTPKRAALKESVRGADAEDMARAYRAMGFSAAVAVRHTMNRLTGAHGEGDDHAIIAVAQDEAALAEVLASQRALATTADASDQAAAVRALGERMGYPACCAAAFASLEDRGDNLANERLPFLRHPEAALHPLLHRTGAVRWVAHHLCSPACAASIAQAERVLALLRAADPEAPERLLAAMRVPSLFLDYDRFASVVGTWESDGFHVTRVVATGRARDLEAQLAKTRTIHLGHHAVILREATGAERTLSAERPLLAIPGEPLDPRARQALGDAAPTFRALAALEKPPNHAVRGVRSPQGSRPIVNDAPTLPAALRPGIRIASYTLASIERREAVQTLWLVRDAERLPVHLRAHLEGTPYTLRKGRWAVDLDAPHALTEAARAAITLIVRALPA